MMLNVDDIIDVIMNCWIPLTNRRTEFRNDSCKVKPITMVEYMTHICKIPIEAALSISQPANPLISKFQRKSLPLTFDHSSSKANTWMRVSNTIRN